MAYQVYIAQDYSNPSLIQIFLSFIDYPTQNLSIDILFGLGEGLPTTKTVMANFIQVNSFASSRLDNTRLTWIHIYDQISIIIFTSILFPFNKNYILCLFNLSIYLSWDISFLVFMGFINKVINFHRLIVSNWLCSLCWLFIPLIITSWQFYTLFYLCNNFFTKLFWYRFDTILQLEGVRLQRLVVKEFINIFKGIFLNFKDDKILKLLEWDQFFYFVFTQS